MAVCFKGAPFPQDIILTCGRWDVAYPLSPRQVKELLGERGASVDHSAVNRTARRAEHAATRVLTKAIRRHGVPETITIAGSEANATAIRRDHAGRGTAIAIRQVQSLHNGVAQEHGSVKRVTRRMLGFKSFEAAQGTLVGIELMHRLKKGPMVVEAGEESLTPAAQFYALAA
jgi:putative transposase